MKSHRIVAMPLLPAVSFLALTVVIRSAAAQTYSLPFFADDLDRGDRFFTRDHAQTPTQKFGYDISLWRINDSGAWESILVSSERHWRNPRNENYRIYGLKFYAMRDGVVMGCWRNAPENPRPKFPSEDSDTIAFANRKWLHQKFRDGLIPGGGNELLIKHDDGSYVLYAHAKRGSIPASICPKSDSLFAAPVADNAPLLDDLVSPPVQLNPRQRRRVRKGDFLGEVGNSGNSTNPHIHIHVVRRDRRGEWEGTPMTFAHGLATAWNDGTATLDGWQSFAGQAIPRGEVLFWPPFRMSNEHARHGVPQDEMQQLFSQLGASGFMPEVMDCYAVNGKVFYNLVWRPAALEWKAHFGMTGANIEERFRSAQSDGLHPVFIDSCSSSEGPRYSAIFQRVSGEYLWRFGVSTTAHDESFARARTEGLSPVNVSVISMGGRRSYTTLYRRISGGYELKSQLNEQEYQQAANDNRTAGRIPSFVSAYIHDGKPHFSVVFSSVAAADWKARHGMTASGYQSEWRSAVASGMLTRSVSGYDGDESHRFVAVWRK